MTYTVGQSGIPFGGGTLKQVQHADGTWGWVDPTTGRTWDGFGNPYEVKATATSAAPTQTTTAGQYVAPGTAPAPNALQQQQSQAQGILDRLPDPIKVNAYQYGKLPGSVKQFVLGAYEAKGYDPADVEEQIKRTLPRAVGPKRGYVAPLGMN